LIENDFTEVSGVGFLVCLKRLTHTTQGSIKIVSGE